MKVKEVLISKTVYESTDGKEFDNQRDAEYHDCKVYFKQNMEDRYCDVDDVGYCVLNSKEELEILQTLSIGEYVQNGFYSHYLDDNIEFPIIVKFEDEFTKPTRLASNCDYRYFKNMAERFQLLCQMYESVIKE